VSNAGSSTKGSRPRVQHGHSAKMTEGTDHDRRINYAHGMKLFVIDSKRFYAGVVLDDDDRVYRCAPIVDYMQGWSERQVLHYAAVKKWTVRVVETEAPQHQVAITN